MATLCRQLSSDYAAGENSSGIFITYNAESNTFATVSPISNGCGKVGVVDLGSEEEEGEEEEGEELDESLDIMDSSLSLGFSDNDSDDVIEVLSDSEEEADKEVEVRAEEVKAEAGGRMPPLLKDGSQGDDEIEKLKVC